jgi:membrane protease YdiL (CAAX protease family)
MTLFLNSDDDLRAGWKFIAYVVVFIAAFIAVKLLLEGIFYNRLVPSNAGLALQILALFVPAMVATLFMLHFVDHLPLVAFGIGLHESWPRNFVVGLAIALGMFGGLLIGTAVLGNLAVTWTGTQFPPGLWAADFGILLLAAATEEIIFRGYPLQVLMKGIGAWPAMLIMSCLFALGHKDNPGATWYSFVNTLIAGLLLSVAYLRTRSLWLPYGIHVGWNMSIGLLVGFPISGIPFPSLWTARADGPASILGGAYGPEGGFLATLVFTCGLVAVYRIINLQVSPRIRATITRNAGKLYASDLN